MSAMGDAVEQDMFVVAGLDERAVRGVAEDAAELEFVRVLGAEGELSLVRYRGANRELLEQWTEVRVRVGDGATVVPVLRDADGSPKYPTGTVVVRFREAPSDEEMNELGRRYELVDVRRNEWQPKQVSFRASGGGVFLPKLVAEIEEEKGVRAAWLEAYVVGRRE
jgi:hypothetical protein